MKKDYSSLFDHYYGLQYDNNVNAVIKVHQLMEDAGIPVSETTNNKLNAYSDKRPFKVHYFISKVGKKLKWCPTASEDKLAKMTLKPAEWWIEQLSDVPATPTVKLPDNWLEEQAKHIFQIQIDAQAAKLKQAKGTEPTAAVHDSFIGVPEESVTCDSSEENIDELPF